ncbi:hypothetical protein U0038_12735 [Sphingobacterium spiritivorum]|uniref:Regulator of chromosome condensation (RCC1) n=1 Tax=Sphingobacterium spiritivorum ATCC 33861 TaxID=525373 RepID=D7VR32_SPHSI|nr:hypothetical protein [Sphingobacterium spiritivorum]EFK56233.1 regulator of chromosome condensation (RCC1) [Sphingobacterium spiritivorum ATCC 33861]QQT35666.1 hypothetical protein I6J01_20790 [Sphingobacterium spiritivorum]WQD32375.1 hypothetical protein U0038_12735 [Sphingobacterium spiritivorum]SUJ08692.1 Cell cycle control protein [Sphingobacterium spiritivorum]
MQYLNKKWTLGIILAVTMLSCSKKDVIDDGGKEPEVEIPQNYWKSISNGQSHSLALSTDGGIYVWGDNTDGQLGTGNKEAVAKPVILTGTQKWSQARTGYSHSLAIATDGTLWAWGANAEGQLGLGNFGEAVTIPTKVGTDTDWSSIAVGGDYSLALKKDGTLWSWGNHQSGRLGNGQTSGRTTVPTKVGAANDWVKIFAWNNWGCGFAIKKDGTLWAWGTSQNYMLGTGTTANQLTPVEVGKGKKWKTVSYARSRNTLAIAEDGTMWAVGRNNKNLLQQGNSTAQENWVQVGKDNDWEDVSIFNLSVLAVKKNGDLYGWGTNTYGELGTGKINKSSTDEESVNEITKISGVSGAKEVLLGFNFSLIRKENNKSICIAGSNLGAFPSLGTGNAASAPILTHGCDITLF